MTVKSAFEIWDLAKRIVNECETENCKKCKGIDSVLHELLVGEDIIREFGYWENKELGLKELTAKAYGGASGWIEEVARRLELVKNNRAAEEMPAELSMIFERLHKKIQAHPVLD